MKLRQRDRVTHLLITQRVVLLQVSNFIVLGDPATILEQFILNYAQRDKEKDVPSHEPSTPMELEEEILLAQLYTMLAILMVKR